MEREEEEKLLKILLSFLENGSTQMLGGSEEAVLGHLLNTLTTDEQRLWVLNSLCSWLASLGDSVDRKGKGKGRRGGRSASASSQGMSDREEKAFPGGLALVRLLLSAIGSLEHRESGIRQLIAFIVERRRITHNPAVQSLCSWLISANEQSPLARAFCLALCTNLERWARSTGQRCPASTTTSEFDGLLAPVAQLELLPALRIANQAQRQRSSILPFHFDTLLLDILTNPQLSFDWALVLVTDLIPSALESSRHRVSSSSSSSSTDDHSVVQLLWQTVLHLRSYEAGAKRALAYTLTCVTFGCFEAEAERATAFDVFEDMQFWSFLQRGVIDDEKSVRKQAIYLLQQALRVLRASNKPRQLCNDSGVFVWTTDKECIDRRDDLWTCWLVLFESVEDQAPHLAEQVLPKFQSPSFVAQSKGVFPVSWLQLAYYNGMRAELSGLRKVIAKHVLSLPNPHMLTLDFILGPLCTCLQSAASPIMHWTGTGKLAKLFHSFVTRCLARKPEESDEHCHQRRVHFLSCLFSTAIRAPHIRLALCLLRYLYLYSSDAALPRFMSKPLLDAWIEFNKQFIHVVAGVRNTFMGFSHVILTSCLCLVQSPLPVPATASVVADPIFGVATDVDCLVTASSVFSPLQLFMSVLEYCRQFPQATPSTFFPVIDALYSLISGSVSALPSPSTFVIEQIAASDACTENQLQRITLFTAAYSSQHEPSWFAECAHALLASNATNTATFLRWAYSVASLLPTSAVDVTPRPWHQAQSKATEFRNDILAFRAATSSSNTDLVEQLEQLDLFVLLVDKFWAHFDSSLVGEWLAEELASALAMRDFTALFSLRTLLRMTCKEEICQRALLNSEQTRAVFQLALDVSASSFDRPAGARHGPSMTAWRQALMHYDVDRWRFFACLAEKSTLVDSPLPRLTATDARSLFDRALDGLDYIEVRNVSSTLACLKQCILLLSPLDNVNSNAGSNDEPQAQHPFDRTTRAAWNRCSWSSTNKSARSLESRAAAVRSYVHFAFDPELLDCLPQAVIESPDNIWKTSFATLLDMAQRGSGISNVLASALCTALRARPNLFRFFVDEVVGLALFGGGNSASHQFGSLRPDVLPNQNNNSNGEEDDSQFISQSTDDTLQLIAFGELDLSSFDSVLWFARAVSIALIVDVGGSDDRVVPLIFERLFSMRTVNPFFQVENAYFHSAAFGFLLHYWQLLNTLTIFLPTNERARTLCSERAFTILEETSGNTFLRKFAELFAAAVATASPSLLLDHVIVPLSSASGYSQDKVSLFTSSRLMVLVHCLPAVEWGRALVNDDGRALPSLHQLGLFLLPFVACHNNLIRNCAHGAFTRYVEHCRASGQAALVDDPCFASLSLYFATNEVVKSSLVQTLEAQRCGLEPLQSIVDLLRYVFIQSAPVWEPCPLGYSSSRREVCLVLDQLATLPTSSSATSQAPEQNAAGGNRTDEGQAKEDVDDDDEAAVTVETEMKHFQVKIDPWSAVSFSEVAGSSTGRSLVAEMKKVVQDVVLVASLVDKTTNLGGLSRTSEIFGVSKMVISDLRILENPQFLRLTMSSEKWLSFEQVSIPRLKDYLVSMRADGYTIVGIEQTIGSRSLEEFEFPKKVVLVLGDEGKGIPADILSILDIALEIPQIGITRSLNVHVSGSLVLWEYTRQRLVSDSHQSAQHCETAIET